MPSNAARSSAGLWVIVWQIAALLSGVSCLKVDADAYIAHGWGIGDIVPFSNEIEFGHAFRYDPAAEDIFGAEGQEPTVEVLCGGYSWVEGPVWLPNLNEADGQTKVQLLFSDVRRNTIYQYNGDGCSKFLSNAGCSHSCSWEDWIEPGPNGMAVSPDTGEVFLAQHGNRSVVAMTLENSAWKSTRLVSSDYEKRRLNSPNDIVFTSEGHMYFSDPPYGLHDMGLSSEDGQLDDHKDRELTENGIYFISRDELKKEKPEITRVGLGTRPNGIGLSRDEKTLFVANSDGSDPHITAYNVLEDGHLETRGKLIDFAKETDIHPELRGPGGVDGMALDVRGYIFQTVPSGVAVVSSTGKLTALLWLGVKVGNCAIGGDGQLYVGADTHLVRINLGLKSQVLEVLNRRQCASARE